MNDNLKKRLKIIFIFTLISLGIFIFSWLIYYIYSDVGMDNNSRIVFPFLYVGPTLSITTIILPLMFNVVSSIFIFFTNWKNNDIDNIKIIWGVLTIAPLGWIASLVFYLISRKKINNGKNENIDKTKN